MSTEIRSFVRFLIILGISFWSFGETSNRTKRELRFPKSASLVTGVALTSILPKGLTDGFVHVLEFDLGFPFPEQFAINEVGLKKSSYKSQLMRKEFEIKRKTQKKYRTSRSVKDEQKRKLLSKVENAFSSLGHNGQACISRFQCELSQISAKNSLLEELLVSLFKTSTRFTEEECSNFKAHCIVSLLHVLLHSEQILNMSD